MPRLLVVGLLLLVACTSAAKSSADNEQALISAARSAKAHVATTNDVIIIIRDPAAAGSKSPVPKVALPTGNGKPKELIVDSFDAIKRLEKRGKQHLQQPKEEQEYKQSAAYPPHREGDDGAGSDQEEYPSKQKPSKGYNAEVDDDGEHNNRQKQYSGRSRHEYKDDSTADDRKYDSGEGKKGTESSRSEDTQDEHEYEHRNNKDDSSSQHKQYKGDDSSSSYQQEEELTEKPDGSSYRPGKHSRSGQEHHEQSDSNSSEEPESSKPPRRNTAGRHYESSQDSASDGKHYKQQQGDDEYQPAPRMDAENEDRHKQQQDGDSSYSDRKYQDQHTDKYPDKYSESEPQADSDPYRPDKNKPEHQDEYDHSGSDDRKDDDEGPGAYPRLEEGGSYYTKPELHTTCLQVMRAAGDASGLATYDLRCCTDSDNPKICDGQDKHDPNAEAGPYSIINRMPTAAPTPKGMMEVLKATNTLKVATCAFMPSDVPCPFYTAGACQVFNGTCMLSKAAADCGCPLNTGMGMLLEVAAYAEPVAGLSCNPVFTVARTGYGVVTNAVDDGAPYLGVANVMHGTGHALEDDDISARMTFISGFGVPEQPMGREVLTDGLPAMPLATKPAYNGRRGYGQRQLPMAFGPAPSSPMPHPNLPFFLGGRMLIEWSSSTGK